jgi:membrane protease YdiL (CAAX protease family)
MNTYLNWKPEYTSPVTAILSSSICFASYWFLSKSRRIEEYFLKKYTSQKASIYFIAYQKLSGFVLMGIIPTCFILFSSDYNLSDLGFTIGDMNQNLKFGLLLSAVIIMINFFVSKRKFTFQMYPQMKVKEWSIRLLLFNACCTITYLLAYEFLFRGILLFVCTNAFGFWPAVAINLAFYSSTHIPKSGQETLGTYPYGLVLCLVTISSGSIFIAFITHFVMAFSLDLFCIKNNPDLKFKF